MSETTSSEMAPPALSLAFFMASSFHQKSILRNSGSDSENLVEIDNDDWNWTIFESGGMSMGRTGCDAVVVEQNLNHEIDNSKGDGKIIVIGGSSGYWSYSNTIEIFDIKQGKWSLSPDLTLNCDRCNFSAVAFLPPNNHKILVIGGCNNEGVLSSVELIDWDLQRVKSVSGLQMSRENMAAVAISSTQILVFGGSDTAALKNVELYDLEENTWTLLPSSEELLEPRISCKAILVGRKIYIIGGTTSTSSISGLLGESSLQQTCEIFDLDSRQMSRGPNLCNPHQETKMHALSIGNGRQLVVFDDTSMELFDPITNEWDSIKISMKSSRQGATSVSIGSNIFIIGGESSYAHYTTVEHLSLNYDIPLPPLSPLEDNDPKDDTSSSQQERQNVIKENDNDTSLPSQVLDSHPPLLQNKSNYLEKLKSWTNKVENQRDLQISKVEALQSDIINNQQIFQADFQAKIYKHETALEKALMKHQEAIAVIQSQMEEQQKQYSESILRLDLARASWVAQVNKQLENTKHQMMQLESTSTDGNKLTESSSMGGISSDGIKIENDNMLDSVDGIIVTASGATAALGQDNKQEGKNVKPSHSTNAATTSKENANKGLNQREMDLASNEDTNNSATVLNDKDESEPSPEDLCVIS